MEIETGERTVPVEAFQVYRVFYSPLEPGLYLVWLPMTVNNGEEK